MEKREPITDKEVLAAREQFLERMLEELRTPYMVFRPEPVKPVEVERFDSFDVWAEQEAEIRAARRIILAALDAYIAQ